MRSNQFRIVELDFLSERFGDLHRVKDVVVSHGGVDYQIGDHVRIARNGYLRARHGNAGVSAEREDQNGVISDDGAPSIAIPHFDVIFIRGFVVP